MKTITNEQLNEAIKIHGENVRAIAKELNISISNAYYRIRNNKTKNPQQVKQISSGTNAPIIKVLKTEIDIVKMIPEHNPNYIKRKIDEIFSRYASRKRKDNNGKYNIVLTGEAGTGKSELPKQYASEKKLPFLRISFDKDMNIKACVGGKEIISGTTYFKTGIFLELIQNPCVILLDEFNAQISGKLFFLHELLDTRQCFVKDYNGGTTVKMNNECLIIMACNPTNALYGGTNATNGALANRANYTLNFEPFDVNDVEILFDTGKEEITNSLKQFYIDAMRTIKDQKLRVALSLRNVLCIVDSIKNGDSVNDALHYGFLNNVLLTASENEKIALEQIARVCFGEHYEQETSI